MRTHSTLLYTLSVITFMVLALIIYHHRQDCKIVRHYAYSIAEGVEIVGRHKNITRHRLSIPGASVQTDIVFHYGSGVLIYCMGANCGKLALKSAQMRYVDAPKYLREAETVDRICFDGRYIFANFNHNGKYRVALLDTTNMSWNLLHGVQRVRANQGVVGIERDDGTIVTSDVFGGRTIFRWKPQGVEDWDVGDGHIYALDGHKNLLVAGIKENRILCQRKTNISSPSAFWQDELSELWITGLTAFGSTAILCYDKQANFLGIDRRGCGTGLCVQYASAGMISAMVSHSPP